MDGRDTQHSDIFSIHGATSLKHEIISLRLKEKEIQRLDPAPKKEYLCHDKIISRISANANIFRSSRVDTLTVDTDHFKYIKGVAVEKVQADVMKEIQILLPFTCPKEERINDLITNIKPFGWSYASFIERRQVPNTLWVDLLRMEYDAQCLQKNKLAADLAELIKLFELLFAGIIRDDRANFKKVMEHVVDTQEFLRSMSALESDHLRLQREFSVAVNNLFKVKFNRTDNKQKVYKQGLAEQLMDVDAVLPIEIRYRVDYHESRVDQTVMKINLVSDNIADQIEEYRQLIKKENFCHDCVMNMYYTVHTKYRDRLAEFTVRIDKEFDVHEARLLAKYSSLTKLRDQRKFLEKEIIRFQKEIKERQLKEITKSKRLPSKSKKKSIKFSGSSIQK